MRRGGGEVREAPHLCCAGSVGGAPAEQLTEEVDGIGAGPRDQ